MLSRSPSFKKFTSSIVSIRSLLSRNKIQPGDFETSDAVYEIKDFDDYKHQTQKSKPFNVDIIEIEQDDNPACGKKFLKIMRRAWATRYTEELSADKVVFLKTALRELITYLFYLVILMVVAYGPRTENLYYLTTAMSNAVTTSNFNSITTMDSFWDYMGGDLLKALYWDTWYNRRNDFPINEREFIYYENKLVGVPQIRQLRTGPKTCQIPSYFQNSFNNCFGDYSKSNANQTNFGSQNDKAWTFTSASETNSYSYGGTFATYDGGGFIQYLSRNVTESNSIISNLQSNLWTDHGTRAVFVDFTVYNANINLYCIVKLVFEFPPTGGCVVSTQIRTVKLLRYESSYDFFILSCEIILVFFIVYYTIEEIIEIHRNRLAYFTKIWNVIDVFMVLMSFISIAINIYRVVKINGIADQLVSNQNQYVNFDFVTIWFKIFNEAVSITTFFGVLKIFKYISFNKTMNQLTDTLGNSLRDITGFAVMFFIVFLAFAQWGYLQFGTKIVDFCRFPDSVFTLFRLVLGDFNFMAIVLANRLIGPIFFISYVFFVFFVLMNMFIAIISDSYEAVKERLAESKDDLEIARFIQTHFFNKFRKSKIVKIQEVLEDSNIAKCEQLLFEDWRNELQRRGYADVEIQALFLQYDADGDRTLDYEERRKMLNDLKQGKISLGEKKDVDSETSQISLRKEEKDSDLVDEELFNDLVERVDSLEKCVFGIVGKVDNILIRLGDIEKAKLDHQKSVSCSLSILRGSQVNITL